MPTLQFRKNLTGTAQPVPTTAADAEPFYAKGGFTATPAHVGGNELLVWDGAAMVPLVSPQRQVELIGAQTITGIKTVSGAGAIAFAAATNMTFGDGAANDVLTKGPGNTLIWSTPAAGTVYTWGVGLVETTPGTIDLEAATDTALGGVLDAPSDGTPYARQDAGWIVLPPGTSYTFGDGLTEAAGTVDLDQATQTEMGGGMIATTALIAAGADDATFVSPLGLRGQLGADAATLATTAKTVIPAINELVPLITGTLRFAGAYDVAGDVTDPVGAGAAGPLPAASAAINGQFYICTSAGAGTGNAPAGPFAVEDWIICGESPTTAGTYAWHQLSVGGTAVTAANVGITAIAGITATDVQGALEELQANKLDAVAVLPALTGDGTAGDPLDVAIVDGGTF